MLGSKYDGRIIGGIFDYCFFVSFLTKVPYIPTDFTPYELILMDGIVRTDTVQMTKVFTENKVRARLEQKFIEYSVPAIINNNATYFAGFFYFALIALLVLESTRCFIKPASRLGVISRSIFTLLISWSLPSTFFYSVLSTLFFSFTETYSAWRKTYYYSMGILTFFITLGSIRYLALTGQIWGFHPTEEAPQTQSNQSTTKHHNTYQKLTIIGINQEFLTPTNKGTIAITFNQISILRYTLMMVLIVVRQEQKFAMLALLLVIQLGFVGAAVYFGFVAKQFNSALTSVIYLTFEGSFTVLITGLLLLSSFTREPNSDKSYSRGTVPLVTVVLLTIILKTLRLIFAAFQESKRSTSNKNTDFVEVGVNRNEGGQQILGTMGNNINQEPRSPNQDEEGEIGRSERSNLKG